MRFVTYHSQVKYSAYQWSIFLVNWSNGLFWSSFLEYLVKLNISVVCLVRESSDEAAKERLISLVPSLRISVKI